MNVSFKAARLVVEMPTSLPSVANLREHWRPRHERTQKLKGDVQVVLEAAPAFALVALAVRARGAVITLTRIARRRYDSDNLAAAFKPIRDGIAKSLGVNDGSRALEWRYEHEQGQPDRIRIAIESAAAPSADVCGEDDPAFKRGARG